MIGTADLSLAQAAGRANPIFLEGKLLPLTASAASELGLKEGDVVPALVQARGNDLALLMRGRMLDLPPNSNLTAGQNLNLQVQIAPNGVLTLVPLAPPPTAAAALPLLPGGAAALFSRVGNLLFRPPGQPSLAQLFSPGVMEALLKNSPRIDLQTQWRGLQLSMAQLTPQALSQAVAAAMGSEVWLARGLPAGPADPKQLLRRLLGELEKTSKDEGGEGLIEGLGELREGIQELEASQVQAVQAQAQREMLFSMMLPFADAEPVELVFRRAPRQGDEAPPLVVNVHSRSQALGEIWLKTQLNNGDKVELTMWALNGAVVEQARQRSAELGQQLSDAGLAMQSFQIMHGARPAQPADWVPSGRGMVVDVAA